MIKTATKLEQEQGRRLTLVGEIRVSTPALRVVVPASDEVMLPV